MFDYSGFLKPDAEGRARLRDLPRLTANRILGRRSTDGNVTELTDADVTAIIKDLVTPRLVHVPISAPLIATVGAWTTTVSNSYVGGVVLTQAPPAINNSVSFPVLLGAGTWSMRFLYRTDSNVGIASISMDGSPIATVDGYSAGTVTNVESTTAGIVVATTGIKTIRFLLGSKNAASSNYQWYMNALNFLRTA